MDLGIMITVNNDDPAYFARTLARTHSFFLHVFVRECKIYFGGYSIQNYTFLIDTFNTKNQCI